MANPEHTQSSGDAGGDASWLTIWNQLSACYHRQRSTLAAAAAHCRLRPDEALTLFFIHHGASAGSSGESPGNNQRALAAAVHVSPAKMSGLLESLRRRALLTPERLEGDRRCQTWALTDLGREMLDQLSRRLPAGLALRERLCLEGGLQLTEANLGVKAGNGMDKTRRPAA